MNKNCLVNRDDSEGSTSAGFDTNLTWKMKLALGYGTQKVQCDLTT